MILYILSLTLIGSVLSLLGGFVLLIKKNWNKKIGLLLTSFAAGVLLATAFFDLLPEALEHMEEAGGGDIFLPMFLGIMLFFILERTVFWFHHHHDAHGSKPTIWMVTIGDALHNFIDGVAIASTTLVNPALGLSTAVAVAAHEVPQEIADFSIYLTQGLSRRKAILMNVLSSLTAIMGALLTILFLDTIEPYLGIIIAFTAGMFIYIALSDLIPELHHSTSKKEALPQLLFFIGGTILVLLFKMFLGDPHA